MECKLKNMASKNKKKFKVKTVFNENQERLSLEILNSSEGLKKDFSNEGICVPGLALCGYTEKFPHGSILLLGRPEIFYLLSKDSIERKNIAEKLLELDVSFLVISDNLESPKELLEAADVKRVCVFRTSLDAIKLITLLSRYLDNLFAPRKTIHGTLVDVYGMGLLFTGRSGIGKSEMALDLIERGHRLVADDVITIVKTGDGILLGSGKEILTHHLEVRGVGIVDVLSLFGIKGVRMQKRIEVEVMLEDDKDINGFDRTGLQVEFSEYLGVKIPLIRIPIYPGKNITVIAEAIAMDNILKLYGYNTSVEFNKKLIARMKGRLK
ncbi:HPr(Ser) kinase/phosphatase [candidate division KSB1 bacterium]